VSDVLKNATPVQYQGNCNAAAVQQMANSGTYQEGPHTAIQTNVDNTKQTPITNNDGKTINRPNLNENSIGGAIYIMTQLKNNNPVMIGVNHGDYDVGNWNAGTNHFVVISGMNKNGDDITFEYYDNAPASRGNTLNVDIESGAISKNGTTVTEVRRNVE
jgi:hypothetical protein